MSIPSEIAAAAQTRRHDGASGWPAAGDSCSAEFRLAAACCRWPPSEFRNAAIQTAAARVTDWPGFLQVARRQRVVGLALDALAAAAVDLPAPIARQLVSRGRAIAAANLVMAGEISRLVRAFDAAQIAVVALKGVALGQLIYGSSASKHNRDIDLLVAPDRAEAAMRLLEQEGYAPVSPAQHLSGAQRRAVVHYGREVEFVRRDGDLRLDLQWRLADNPTLLRGVDTDAPMQRVTLPDGTGVRTFAEEDLFAHLCVHGAYHAWSRLKWLADLNALIAASNADVVRLYGHAQSRGAGLCAGLALQLCRLLFDLRLPSALAAELQGSRRIERLVTIALKAMTRPRVHADDMASIARSTYGQFLLGRGWAFYAGQCRVAAVSIFDVIALPLPPAFCFLYLPLRLPLWLWRRATASRRR